MAANPLLRRSRLLLVLSLLIPVLATWAAGLEYEQNLSSCKQIDGGPAVLGQGSPEVVVYTNRTAGNVNVTGDLIVQTTSCTVRVAFGPGPADFYEVSSDGKTVAQDSSTVTVPPNNTVRINCRLTPKRAACHWKYQRSSP